MKVFRRALGDPAEFLHNVSALALDFRAASHVYDPGLGEIRKFVADRNYQLTNDPKAFRASVAAFAVCLVNQHAQNLVLRGIFRKRIVVHSKRFSCDLLELFYRCVFEGLDLDVPVDNRPG